MRYATLLLAAWISGCGIAEYDDYPAAIADAFHAQDAKVTISTLADSKSGSQRTFIATLIGDHRTAVIWNPKSKIASGCAKFIFERMNIQQRKDFDQIQIRLVLNDDETQFNYRMDHLELINPYLNVVNNYLQHVCSKDYSALASFVDTVFVTSDDQQSFLLSYAQIDSVLGGQASPLIEGFTIDTLNYSSKLPIVRVWAITASPDRSNQYYRFILSNDGQPPRILAVGLNDE